MIHFKIAAENEESNSKYWLYYVLVIFKLNKNDLLEETFLKLKSLNISIPFYQIYEIKNYLNSIDKFIYEFITKSGFYLSNKEKVSNFNNKKLALLTNSFLFWFETQNWKKFHLLELGAGNSTHYFSKYFGKLTSYETNKKWFEDIQREKPKNVKLKNTKSILEVISKEDIINYDVILIDSAENRLSITKEIIKKNFSGIIFFDNSDLYRESIKTFIKNDYIEIPFFGIKPIEINISCTSLLIKFSKYREIFDPNWQVYPFLSKSIKNNIWDN